ncbi:hypothetical protein J2W34_004412 [Variovorax boronicumulans]|uniref:YfjI family protein n=1 Tax=Variovorax boronicumulans TaxID=436515 RepID=UPI00278104DA|nr:YfjI family protein [Variovorax boronicumulans]MDQ0072607.1 hypothetical protein [Variovorax boronicumulans]
MQRVIYEVGSTVQPPVELAFASALGTLSLACQISRRVRVPAGYSCNVGVFLVTIAGSGVRKSSTDRPFMAPVRNFQAECDADLSDRLAAFDRARRIWESERRGLERAISAARARNKPIDGFTAEMKSLYEREPQRPMGYKLIVEDATPEAFVQILSKTYSTTGIFSDEGGTVLNAPVLRSLEMLNKAWSGDSITVDRVSSGSASSHWTNLTLSLMAQPRVVERFLGKADNHARESGFISRCLLSRPDFVAGYRTIQAGSQLGDGMDDWNRRITRLLRANHPIGSMPKPPETVYFSWTAGEAWLRFAQRVEIFQQPGEMFFTIPDSASKMAENCARIAALFHCLESDDLEIKEASVLSAIAVCEFYLHEFAAIFRVRSEDDKDREHALKIVSFLQEECVRNGRNPYIPVRLILQYGPPPRTRNSRDRALRVLEQDGMARIVRDRSQILLLLNPHHFPVDEIKGMKNNGFEEPSANLI